MQINTKKVLEYMKENKDSKKNHFHDEDFMSLGFSKEYLHIYLKELEENKIIEIDRQWLYPVYSLV